MSDAEFLQDRTGPEPTALKTFGAQCAVLAEQVLCAPIDHHPELALTLDGGVAIPIEVSPNGQVQRWQSTLRCGLRVAEGRLVDTLAGVGTGPLPWE